MSHFDLSNPSTLFLPTHIEERATTNVDENAFREILKHGHEMSISDISIQELSPIMIKINNLVYPITKRPLTRHIVQKMISILHGASEGDNSAYQKIMHGQPSNSTYSFKILNEDGTRTSVRYRYNVIRDQEVSVCITMRLNNDEIKDLSNIGLDENHVIYKNMFPMKGLNLITGSVDSGKTTLIYACLGHFIKYSPRAAFIHTYESPIEGNLKGYAHRHRVMNKVVSQTPVPGGVKTFTEGIENSLRRNTDIILIGEIRTRSEVEAVMTGVNVTGKLLMGTLHTDSTAMTIDRLINALHSENESETRAKVYQLLSAMNMIVSQKLLSTVDKKRIAVNECLTFDIALKRRLQNIPPEKLTREIEEIMLNSNGTMVHKAKEHMLSGRISKDVYNEFKSSFSYGGEV